jgi:hypothetical protein
MSNKREGKRRHILTLNQPLEQAYPQEHQVPEKPTKINFCFHLTQEGNLKQ